MRQLNQGNLFTLLLATLVLLLSACADSDVERLASAKSSLEQNKQREAVILLKNALKSNPDNAEARYMLGVIQLDAGDVASSEKEFKRALELGWNQEQASIDLARSLLLQVKYDEVEAMSAGDSWSKDGKANLLAMKSIARASTGDTTKARELLEQAEKQSAEALYVLKTRAQFHLLDKQLDKAVSVLDQALANYPDSHELMTLKARVLAAQNRMDDAGEVYKAVIADQPANMLTRFGREALLEQARIELLNDRLDEAKKLIARLRTQVANDPAAHYLSAVIGFKEAKYDEAEIELRKILQVAPEHGPSQVLFGTISFASGKYEQAAFYLSKYVAANPDNLKARKLLGQTYLALKQHDKAEDTLRGAAATAADDAELLALTGLSSMHGGKSGVGISELQRAVSLAPDSPAIRNELAKAYISSGKTDLAIRELEKIIEGGEGAYRAKVMVVLAYLNDKRYTEATIEAEKLLEANPEDANLANLMGIVKHSSGDTAAAITYFERALSIDSAHVGAATNLARLQEGKGDIEGARASYLAMHKQDPDNVNVMLSLSRIAYSSGDIEGQVGWLQKIRQASDQDMKSRVALVEYHVNRQEFAQAEELIKELETIDENSPLVLTVQAEYLIARGSHNQASIVTRKLVEVAPEMYIGHYLEGLNLLKMERLAEAKTSLQRADKLFQGDMKTIILLSRIHFADGESAQALALGQRMTKLEPGNAIGYITSGDAHAAMAEFDKALAAYDRAWQVQQTSPVMQKRITAMRKLGKKQEAYTMIGDWLQKNPDDIVVRFGLAEAYQLDERYAEARQEYEKLLKDQPESIVALNNIAWAYHETGNSGAALENAEKAYKLNQSPIIKDTYGWMMLHAGQEKEGLGMLEQAAKEYATEPQIQYHLAVAYHRTGDQQKAYQMLDQLLASGAEFDGKEAARELLNQR